MGKNSNFNARISNLELSPARLSAYEILLRIEKEKSFSSALLPIYEGALGVKDRGLCHELTLGILRKQIYLDAVIEKFTVKKIDLEVRLALRIGLYQILFLNKIPAYSAINESVNLVVKAKKTSAKGFVNAILRRATREEVSLSFADEIERISVQTSHPAWLVRKWIEQFGIEKTTKIAEANNELPGADFRTTARTNAAVKASIETKDFALERDFFRDLAENGKIYFQDQASQLVAEIARLKPDEKFLDVCAAPGSKLTQIATEVDQPVFGGDFHFQRVRLMRKLAQVQGLQNIRVLQFDAASDLPFADESFDTVLVDAPCSGTGTIRHNPEIRYHLNENDFDGLCGKQLKILKNASNVVKYGGRIIYSTCSLEREENESVIEKFLRDNPKFSKVQNKQFSRFETSDGFLRTYPDRDKMDGFFVAELRKL